MQERCGSRPERANRDTFNGRKSFRHRDLVCSALGKHKNTNREHTKKDIPRECPFLVVRYKKVLTREKETCRKRLGGWGMEPMKRNRNLCKQAAVQSAEVLEQWKRKSKKLLRYRLILCAALGIAVTALFLTVWYQIGSRIPSTIYIRAGEKQKIDLHLPATGSVKATAGMEKSNIPKGAVTIDLSEPVTMFSGAQDAYDMQIKLFGILPLKQVDIKVIKEKELIPAGVPVGLYMESDGVLVVGIADFTDQNGRKVSPSKNIVKSGDYVKKANGREVTKKQELMEAIGSSQGQEIELEIVRNQKPMTVRLVPQQNAVGEYKAGIWIRDNIQGVGTLTYLDGDGNFGALGHGITDVDTGLLMDVSGGTMYETEIVNVKKGKDGDPGEMTGRIVYAQDYAIGEIQANSVRGVFGSGTDKLMRYVSQDPVPIALKQEIELGKAQILCTIEEQPEFFEVEITKIHLDHDNVNRGIELVITDERLISLTGGIVQGMSGSPILQNGKIIGAVTHVLVNEPEKGYGIFIENMLEQNAG